MLAQQTPEAALGQIAITLSDIEALDDRLQHEVDQARELGVSWHRIGLVLDMTAVGVQRRFDREARDKNLAYNREYHRRTRSGA